MYDKFLARFVSCMAFFKPPASKQNHKTFKTGPSSWHDFCVTTEAKLSINSVYSADYGYVGLFRALWGCVLLCRIAHGYVGLWTTV